MIEFTDSQRKTIANGLTLLSAAVVVAFVGFLVWAAFKLLAACSSALVPVFLGFFLALFFRPYFHLLKRVLRNPTAALAVMLLSVFLPLGFFLWYAGSVLLDQVASLIRQGPALVAAVTQWFNATFPKMKTLLDQLGVPYDRIGELYVGYGDTALRAGFGALKCFSVLVAALITLIFFVFFLTTRERRGGEVVAEMPFLKDETKAFVATQIDAFFDILVSFFQRQAVICLIEGVLYGTGFALVGLPYGFLVGFALGVLNLVPFFGSIVCLPVALPLAYFVHGGSLSRLLMVVGVWGCGQILDGYFITPKIQGNKTGLGYAGVLFSFFFWATVFGPFLGMLLAIPLSAFCVVLWRALKSRYITPVV